MKKSKSIFFAMMLLAGFGLLQGCASTGAQLCAIDPLRYPDIRFDDAKHSYVIDDHIFFSKEATSGGSGIGGGGCGCN